MAERLANKLLLIGWDGADWQIIRPLLDGGQMPNLKKIVESGVMGNFASMNPMISPMLWTTMATGKPPHLHGVCGFVEPDPESETGRKLTGSTSRKCKAFWNIFSQEDFKTHVVGWYAGHPAEPINGVCVSERFAKAYQTIEQGWPVPAGSVHPLTLEQDLSELRVHPQQIGLEHLEPLVPTAREIDQSKDNRLATLAKNLGQCATNQAITTWILETQQWDVVATYFNTIDMICHSFMYFHPPKMQHVPAELFERYDDVVNGIYRFHDLMLGRQMELAGDDATVVIVSDHGYKNGNSRPTLTPSDPAGAILWHRPYGMIAMSGPALKKDELIFGGRIIDLTPTILTLMGLPVGEDMTGTPLLQAFKQPVDVTKIPSWEKVEGPSGLHDESMLSDPVAELEVMKQLEALGYLEPVVGSRKAVMDQTTQEIQFNIARSFISAGRHADAVGLLEEVAKRQPRRLEVAFNLADCYQTIGRNDECRSVIDRIVSEHLEDKAMESTSARIVPHLDYMYGLVELNSGNNEAALARLRSAEEQMGDHPARDFHKNLGNAYLRMELWSDAEKSYDRALLADSDDPQALHGLAIVAIHQQRNRDAVDYALQSLQILFQQPRAHFHLGIACFRLNDLDRARQAFETYLSMRPASKEGQQKLLEVCRAIDAAKKKSQS